MFGSWWALINSRSLSFLAYTKYNERKTINSTSKAKKIPNKIKYFFVLKRGFFEGFSCSLKWFMPREVGDYASGSSGFILGCSYLYLNWRICMVWLFWWVRFRFLEASGSCIKFVFYSDYTGLFILLMSLIFKK